MNSYKTSTTNYFKSAIVTLCIFMLGYVLFNTNYTNLSNKIASKFSFMDKAEAQTTFEQKNSFYIKKNTVHQIHKMPKSSTNDDFQNKITFE